MKIYFFAIGVVLFCACSGSNSTTQSIEGSSTSSVDVQDSGYVRKIDPVTGDTIYVKDTVLVYADTSLRWIGNSALLITEIASLNLDWLDQDGDDPSWIEIYNAGSESANLKGYSLVENLKDSKKWVFGDELIAAKSFRTVFCDKKNIASVNGVPDGRDSEGRILHSRTHTNWKMDKKGGTIYLIDPSNGIRDSVSYPELSSGVSWGIVDGGDWKYFGTSTPERKNTEATAYDDMSPSVDMSSITAGFYNSEFVINPPALESGVSLRCTKDGTVPTAYSEEFNSPMAITKSTPLRCSAFKNGTLTKEVITKTLFIGETVKMPVVAISVNPEFFQKHYVHTSAGSPSAADPNKTGLYADVEYPVHVEYFENGSETKGATWEFDAGISLMGNYSRLEDKKSVAIVLREDYQDGKIRYPLFETRKETNSAFRGFNLRNNGNRFVSDYLEDAMGGALLEGSGVDYQRSRQVVVFYNGKYYGIHDMRERYNKHYVETNYGIDAGTVEVIKHLGHSITSNTTTANYEKLLDFVNSSDLSGSNNANYATIKTMMDVGNFADYMAFEIYIHNGDWPDNNVRAWRAPDQPYKFMVYDLDHGMDWTWKVNGFNPDPTNGTNMFNWIKQGGTNYKSDNRSFASLFNHLIKNPDFKRLFINRAIYLYQNFVNSTRVKSTLETMAATLVDSETERDMEKYDRTNRGYSNTCGKGFSISGSCMKTWATARDASILSDYQKEFGVGSLVTMKIAASGNGSVLMENRTIPASYSGKFFSGNTMELTAVAGAGAVFTGWSDGNTSNPRIVDITEGASFTANFK